MSLNSLIGSLADAPLDTIFVLLGFICLFIGTTRLKRLKLVPTTRIIWNVTGLVLLGLSLVLFVWSKF